MRKITVEQMKTEIKDRYDRLKNGKRRPSLEYISTQDLREVFLPYSKDPIEFMKMSDEDIRRLYQEWHEMIIEQQQREKEEKLFELPELK